MSPESAAEEITAFTEENSGSLIDVYSEFSNDHLYARISAINMVLWMRSKESEK